MVWFLLEANEMRYVAVYFGYTRVLIEMKHYDLYHKLLMGGK